MLALLGAYLLASGRKTGDTQAQELPPRYGGGSSACASLGMPSLSPGLETEVGRACRHRPPILLLGDLGQAQISL